EAGAGGHREARPERAEQARKEQVAEAHPPRGAPPRVGLVGAEPEELGRPVARMDRTPRPLPHGLDVELRAQRLRGRAPAAVAPEIQRRDRLAALVRAGEAVP